MLPYRHTKIGTAAVIFFFLLLAGYAYYEGRGLLFGPSIDVAAGPMLVHESYITIKGRAEHISSLSMNGGRISVTKEGNFEQPFLLAEGYNYILLDAEDRAGRKTHKKLEIIYQPPPPNAGGTEATTTVGTSSPPQATSTPR